MTMVLQLSGKIGLYHEGVYDVLRGVVERNLIGASASGETTITVDELGLVRTIQIVLPVHSTLQLSLIFVV